MPPDCYAIGEVPPLGVVPRKMLAHVIRPSRYGPPKTAFQVEEIDVPKLGPKDVLVLVMAAGINYNNVWAAQGEPVDVCKLHARFGEPVDFHVGGSDASGIVYAVGDQVTRVKVGDPVVLHCGRWDPDAKEIREGMDPTFHASFHIWGYESNYGSFAQFTRVQELQCMPKWPHLTWEEAAAPTLVGATIYRMLHGWPPNVVKPGDPVLVWGGAGGLGCMAIQLAVKAGARPVAVVSTEERGEFCKRLGAVGYVNRARFDHWGMIPHWKDSRAYDQWQEGAKAFGQAFWKALGEKKSPTLVVEHPGESTLPTSLFLCSTGGMVVICAGTTGYTATLDLRYLWMRQKRLQGSHYATGEQCLAFNELLKAGVSPCLSRAFPFSELGQAHQLMRDNRHPDGNMVVMVSTPRPGLTSAP